MNISDLPGMLPQKAAQFKKKGIETVEDLLDFLPRRYNDLSQLTGLPQWSSDTPCSAKVRILDYKVYRKNTFAIIAVCREVDTGKRLEVQWFNQKWMVQTVSSLMGMEVLVSGKVDYDDKYRTYKICNPLIFTPDINRGLGIYPIYPSIPGMTDAYITTTVKKALDTSAARREICPADIISRENLPSMEKTYRYIYTPESMAEVEAGQQRILFNDLLYFSLNVEWAERAIPKGTAMNIKTLSLFNQILSDLPYELTPDQKSALDTICAIGKSGQRLNGLLQGDVGCGKTNVAQLAMAAFAGSGYQSVLMAPTQVLAEQHYEETEKLFSPYGVEVCYLAGSMSAAEKKKKYERIASGSAKIIIGTTSVLSRDIEYNSLALVIADEQHRFGVAQRAALVERAKTGVHSLTMSATPIPRSLAISMYGDTVQLLTIKTMPAGRKPVRTGIARGRMAIYEYIKKQAAMGHQAYVVCPQIERGDTGAASVEQIYEEYRKYLEPAGLKIETLTGKKSAKETTEIIDRFKSGETDVLVATTVIEVGVNVPNATTMVISNAERFGLSTLHQLRGRVGRSSLDSICVLESTATAGDAKERLDAMCRTTDGFEIAQEDLRIRGAGDFIGTQQSGENKYISLMLAYPEMYERAKAAAAEILDRGYDCCELANKVYKEKTDTEETAA